MTDEDSRAQAAPSLVLDSLPKQAVARLVGAIAVDRVHRWVWVSDGDVEDFQRRAQALPQEIRGHMGALPAVVEAGDEVFERLMIYLEDLAAADFTAPGARGRYVNAIDDLDRRIAERIDEWRGQGSAAALNRFLDENWWLDTLE
jgi:hypothetical protein